MNYQEFQALLEARTRWLEGKSRALRGELRAMLMDERTFTATYGERPSSWYIPWVPAISTTALEWENRFDEPWARRIAPKARDVRVALANLRDLQRLQQSGLSGAPTAPVQFNTWVERSNGVVEEGVSVYNSWINHPSSGKDRINTSASERLFRFFMTSPGGRAVQAATGTTAHQAWETAGGVLETVLPEDTGSAAASSKERILGPLGPQAATTSGNGGGLPTWIVPIAVGTLVIGAGALIYRNWTTGGAVARTGEYAAGRDDRYRGR